MTSRSTIVRSISALGGRPASIDLNSDTDLSLLEEFLGYLEITGHGRHGSLTGHIGSWPVSIQEGDGAYIFYEMSPDQEQGNVGLNFSFEIWSSQRNGCRLAKVKFKPAKASEYAAVSPDFLDCTGLQGVRVRAEPEMSGWWIYSFDDIYNVRFELFEPMPIFKVIASRTEIAKYLALPAGYRFYEPVNMITPDVDPRRLPPTTRAS